MKKIIVYLVTIIFIFSSCASVKQSKIAINTTFDSKSTNGLIVGTITFVCKKKKSPFDKYRFHLTYVTDNVEEAKNISTFFTVNVNQFNGRFNGELNEKKTYPILLEQKPGKYNFDGFWFFWNGGLITNEFSNPVHFSLPITVEQSKIIYIGNIIINVKSSDNPYIEITDKFDIDVDYFKAKYQNIDWNLISNKTLKEGDNGNGFVKLN